jgi:hypothetical protein
MVTACESAGDPAPPTAASGAAKPGAPEVARIGAAGSACDMPVTFGLAASWKPKAVTITPDDPLADLARKGPLTMVCEIDAKPSGAIGFLRVWTGDKAELRSTLQAFIGTGAREPAFTDLRINDRPAVEVVYQEKSQADDELEQERAFAVETTSGVAAVSLDSFDSEEHKAMLPAYELAKASLTVTR